MRRRALLFMAACVCASATSLFCPALGAAGAVASVTAPRRVVSLNLCTDELLLLLAEPGQVASVTHLARSRDEFPFWRTARRYPANDGSILSVAGMRPDLVVTMGGLARDRRTLASRLGAELLVLPFPSRLEDLENSVRLLAARLGREERGERLLAALRHLRETVPASTRPGLFLTGAGETHAPNSIGAQWLELAGIANPEDLGGQVPAERILIAPPSLVVRSDYRRHQVSRGHGWPGFRFLDRRAGGRTIWTDGRRWTCGGLSLMPEIIRLREEIGG